MIKIGEFSKLVQVPAPTLRYYDQLGLLKPVEVDRYPIAGPDRELNLYHTMPIRLDGPACVTEIQYPVEKEQQDD